MKSRKNLDLIDKKDEFLIVSSVLIAIIASKIADFLLPLTIKYQFFGCPSIDIWIGLIANLVIIFFLSLFFFKIIKFIWKKLI